MLALACESSCDETAVAIVSATGEVKSSIIASQLAQHRPYGGVVPEVAARAHLACIDELCEVALAQAGVALHEIDVIASTCGPGLIGGLLVGVMYGRALARAQNKPWLGINHLEGHALTARLTDRVAFPYLLLLVSGGHTQLLLVKGVGDYQRLGTTLDDAAGECFDKAAKLLGLGYPGGPALEKAAAGGQAKSFELPIPMQGHASCNFSFSGLKTAVRHKVAQLGTPTPQQVADLAAATQHSIAQSLTDRTRRALDQLDVRPSAIVVAGGVAANGEVRRQLTALAQRYKLPLLAPPLNLCGDNAAMIAWAALERVQAGIGACDDGHARPRWPLDPHAAPAGLVGRTKQA